MIPAPRLVCVELNPGPALTAAQREEIFTLHNKAKMSPEEIAEAVNVHPKTVNRTLEKYKNRPTLKNLPGQGRKRKLTPELMKRVKQKAKRKKSATKIAHEIHDEVKGGLSERSVQRHLKDAGKKYLVVEEVEELTPEQEKRRLKFAKDYKNYNWDYVLFADEKSWELRSTLHKCWQDPAHRVKRVKTRHPAKIHCWGGIGLHFKTKLHFFKPNLTSNLFCNILKKRLPPEYKYNLYPKQHGKWILVQDNDPKHKSKKTTELLNKLAPNRIRDFPVNSPDFNPIEDVWSMLQSAIQYKKIKSIDSLKRHLTAAWENLDMNEVRNSIESLPTRFQQCIKRKGKRTDY
jgi:transposase